MFISNKNKMCEIFMRSCPKFWYFFYFFSFPLLFFPPLTWLSSPLIIMPRRFPGRGAAIRLNHLDKAAWPNYTRAPSGFDVAEKPRDRGKLHSHIMVMIWFNPATKLYVACLKKMLMLITEVRRGVGWDRVERVERRGVWLQQQSWWEFGIDKALLINVVNENETNWTHFHLIMYPAQVKRSEVLRNTCNLQTCWATASNWHILGGEVDRLQWRE